jgi:DNA-binding NtrC family response regulator
MVSSCLPNHVLMVHSPELVQGTARVLLVDDSSDLRLTLSEFLTDRGFRVTCAKNGTEAIHLLNQAASSKPYDMVFTDLRMPPGPDGLEVLKAARIRNPHTSVVVMTGFSSIDTAIESIRLGAFDYLTKPFQVAELEIVANRILERQVLLEDNRTLSQKVHSLTEKFSSTDTRLERIEALLGRLSAILLKEPKH